MHIPFHILCARRERPLLLIVYSDFLWRYPNINKGYINRNAAVWRMSHSGQMWRRTQLRWTRTTRMRSGWTTGPHAICRWQWANPIRLGRYTTRTTTTIVNVVFKQNKVFRELKRVLFMWFWHWRLAHEQHVLVQETGPPGRFHVRKLHAVRQAGYPFCKELMHKTVYTSSWQCEEGKVDSIVNTLCQHTSSYPAQSNHLLQVWCKPGWVKTCKHDILRVVWCLMINRNTPIRVRAGSKNSRPVGFLQ